MKSGLTPTHELIQACMRRVRLAAAANVLILAAFVIAMMSGERFGAFGSFMPLIVVAFWASLSLRGLRAGRDAATTPAAIAAGQFEIAERQLDDEMHSFTLLRAPKLLGLHHLAMLRQAQGRWAESAMTCQALLSQRLGKLQLLETAAALMLADASLEIGDLTGARHSVQRLRTLDRTQSGGVLESLKQMAIEVELLSREGHHAQATLNIASRAELAELLPPPLAARTFGFLALSAAATHPSWHDYLARKFRLLCNAEVLNRRPQLKALVDANDS